MTKENFPFKADFLARTKEDDVGWAQRMDDKLVSACTTRKQAVVALLKMVEVLEPAEIQAIFGKWPDGLPLAPPVLHPAVIAFVREVLARRAGTPGEAVVQEAERDAPKRRPKTPRKGRQNAG